MNFDVVFGLFWIVSLLFSGIVHEQAHARVAYLLGDSTGRDQGRFSWNPAVHIDPWMSFFLPGLLFLTTGFAYGGMKPVPINPMNFRHPTLGLAYSAVAGPFSNFLLAILGFLLLWLAWAVAPEYVVSSSRGALTLNGRFFLIFVTANLFLGAFNLLPLPGLDGSRLLYHFLTRGGQVLMDRIEPFALLITMAIVFRFSGLLLTPVSRLLRGSLHAILGSEFAMAL